VLELDPVLVDAYYFRGVAYIKKSMYVAAMADFEKGAAIAPDSELALTGVGYGCAVTGRKSEAQEVLEKLSALSTQKYLSPIWMAKVYAGLDDKDKAFEWLEKAYEDRSIVSAGYVKSNPILDPLRSDPRYADLLRRTYLSL
jgi:tetratricopeptide (TPR) repeat protein